VDDLQAIRQLKAGDIAGLEWLIAGHQERALRTAYLILQDKMAAEDVVYESFVRFYERVRHFDESRPFEPYFLRSVVNASLNHVRREKRQAPMEAAGESAGLDTLLEQAAGVEDQAEWNGIRRQVREALRELPARQRAAVVLRYYLGMSEQEMASELDAPPGTVKWLLSEARAKLRELLGAGRMAE
jgi:RNA polymerase sigma-70 factor (ECF subfamily)